MEEKGTDLAIAEGGLPNIDQAKTILENFRGIKREVLTSHEFYEVETEEDGQKIRREILNRRGCSILSLIFQLSEPEPPEVTVTDLPDGVTLFRVRTCIQAPNGRRAYGVGSCSTKEIKAKGPRVYHDAESRAHTRAKERAVMDLVGGGEVTAEETNHNGARKPRCPGNGRAGKLNFIEEFIEILNIGRGEVAGRIKARFGTDALSKLGDEQLDELVGLIEASTDDQDFIEKLKGGD